MSPGPTDGQTAAERDQATNLARAQDQGSSPACRRPRQAATCKCVLGLAALMLAGFLWRLQKEGA